MKKIKPLDILMLILLILSIIIFLYPFIQNELNTFMDQKIINYYQEQANKENDDTRKRQRQQNKQLAKEKADPGITSFNETVDHDNATKQKKIPMDYYQEHTLGILYIPSIKVKIPLFDITNDVLLQKGASLLEGSSFPSTDDTSHAIISAHRGLPEATLFTDLPKMKQGDPFFIDINGERLAYEVIEIATIEPTDTSSLVIRDNENLVTLLTCTPYMVNSHRLIVTGKQVPYKAINHEKDINAISKWERLRLYLLIVSVLLFTLITVFILFKWYKRRMILNTSYSLKIMLKDHKKKPLKQQQITLTPLWLKQQPITLVTNEKGMVYVPSIPGNAYSLTLEKSKYKSAPPVRLSIKRLNDTFFTASSKNKKKSQVITIKSRPSYIKLLYRYKTTTKK